MNCLYLFCPSVRLSPCSPISFSTSSVFLSTLFPSVSFFFASLLPRNFPLRTFCILSSQCFHLLWFPSLTSHLLSILLSFCLSPSQFCFYFYSRWLLESSPSVAYREKEAHLAESGIDSSEIFVNQQITWLQFLSGTAVATVWWVRNMIQPHLRSRENTLRLNRSVTVKARLWCFQQMSGYISLLYKTFIIHVLFLSVCKTDIKNKRAYRPLFSVSATGYCRDVFYICKIKCV